MGLIPTMQWWYKILKKKSTFNIPHQRMKEKYIVISLDTEKAFEKNPIAWLSTRGSHL
jgi:hypothetical protein